MWNLREGNILTGGIQVDRHRIANVYGPKGTWGGPSAQIHAEGDKYAGLRTKADHHGLNMSEAIRRMSGDTAHVSRAHRFFANGEHEKLFAQAYPGAFEVVRSLERKGVSSDDKASLRLILSTHCKSSHDAMRGAVKEHFEGFCAERGVA